MKINLEIENYKSIGKINIKLNKNSNRIITLVGRNNAGKTKILEAIQRLGGSTTFLENERRTFYNEKGDVVQSPDLPSIKLEFLLENGNDEINIQTKIMSNLYFSPTLSQKNYKEINSEISEEFEKLEETNYKDHGVFHHGLTTFSSEYTYEALKTKIAKSNSDDILKIIKKIRRLAILLKFSTKKIDVAWIKDNDLFKYDKLPLSLIFKDKSEMGFEDPEFSKKLSIIRTWEKILKMNLDEIISNNTQENDNRNKHNQLQKFQDRANKLINSISNDFFENDSEINFKFSIYINPTDLTLNINLESSKDISHDGWTWNYDLGNSGDGMKRLFSIIFRLNSIDEDDAKIILLDEPEKSLNPVHQKYLAKYIGKLMDSNSPKRRNQIIIYATHSPFMIGMEMYQNIFTVERDVINNSTITNPIYNVAGKNVPNMLLDKNIELRFLEANLSIKKPDIVLFVEGITDFFVMNNILENVFIIPLFGSEYVKTASFHLPYLLPWSHSKIKLLVDDDVGGINIIEWFQKNSNLTNDNIKKYSDLFPGKIDLEDSIITPWFNKNNDFELTSDKKINSIIFTKNNIKREPYKDLIEFVNKDVK